MNHLHALRGTLICNLKYNAYYSGLPGDTETFHSDMKFLNKATMQFGVQNCVELALCSEGRLSSQISLSLRVYMQWHHEEIMGFHISLVTVLDEW